MPDPLPLNLDDHVRWWLNHPEGSRALYHPQGYEGLTSEDRTVEMYVITVLDFDLEVHFCISVRWRPYLAMERSQEVWDANPEVRDHLFLSVELLKRWPEQEGPIWRAAWMGRPHHPFDKDSPTTREVMTALLDFIEGAPHTPCTPIEARWCPRCGDCRCEADWSDLANPDCPLHGMDSDHPKVYPADEPSH